MRPIDRLRWIQRQLTVLQFRLDELRREWALAVILSKADWPLAPGLALRDLRTIYTKLEALDRERETLVKQLEDLDRDVE